MNFATAARPWVTIAPTPSNVRDRAAITRLSDLARVGDKVTVYY